ncbi:MAG: RagB/SusD family nutrient uptake outer membrane protein, partial [Prevotella sp.]
KVALEPYTSIKFGMKNGVGNTTNTSDFPLMRIEEMYLIAAEGYARSGNEAKAREILTNFVKTYRDPSYDINGRGLSLVDEIWFQRRVELWGEGFFTPDAKRLGKPIVRFHQGVENNFSSAYQFNIAADDGWLNMRFPQGEKDNNLSIVDNEGGALPVAGQNGNLRDGVTD